jgi:outer membrane protein assembly factor BamB
MSDKKKQATIAIALLLMVSMSASVMLVPNASAHYPAWQIPTHAYILVMPNPIGVGQSLTVYVWLDKTFGSNPAAIASNAARENNYRFHNYQVIITKPDKTTETHTWDTIWDTTSSQMFYFTPDQVGTYIFNFSFPGQAYNQYAGGYNPASIMVNDTYLPSAASTTLTVQQEPLPAPISSYPLPSQYWTRPIYGENTDWWSISSNWYGTGFPQFWSMTWAVNTFVPDAVGSQTAHIMWTKPIQAGGVVGGNQFTSPGVGFFEGSAYINRYGNPIILNGKLYYTEPVAFSSSTGGPTDCVDLRTGELIWSRNDVPSLSFGYIWNFWNPNQHGTWPPILFTSNFARAFDADTGDPLFNVTGVPTGRAALGLNGEYLRYVFANAGNSTSPDWRLGQWNSSRLWEASGLSYVVYNASNRATWSITGSTVTPTGTPGAYTSQAFIVDGSVSNPSRVDCRYDWNVSVPWLNVMGNQTLNTQTTASGESRIVKGGLSATWTPTVIGAFCNDMILCYNGSLPSAGTAFYGTSWAPYTYFAVNLNPSKGAIGSIPWMKTYDPPAGNLTVLPAGVDPVARVFYEDLKETMQYVAYSMDTGQKLWGPTASQPALDYYGNDFGGNLDAQLAYGRLYSVGFAGILYCYNQTNGDLLWTYGNGGPGNSTNAGLNTFYGDYPTFIQAIGNGVVYMDTTEHTITDPIYKGALTRAVNATTGKEIWTLSAYTGGGNTIVSYAIADGFTTFFNGYDNQIYVVGRGPSATTVQAPLTAVTAGDNVVIQGTVLDVSAGTKQKQQAANFPYGVPCVSDDSMSDWMGYVYQQKPHPASATGVTVTLDAIDPNNNFIHIGTATSDTAGLFTYAWTPSNIPGKYTVIATFPGTNSYWPSYAETGMYVSETPPSPTPTPAAAPLPPFDMYILAATVAIIIAIALAAIWIKRK